MKRLIFVLLIQISFVYNTFTQDPVYTPKGHIVEASYVTDEWLDEERRYFDSVYTHNYPYAQLIYTYGGYSTTKKFNCHGYAWHVSEGGDYVWIGYGPYNKHEEIYWTDYLNPSYIQTQPNTKGARVSYGYFITHDHSAVVADPSIYGENWVVAKWGSKVLMRHRIDQGPNDYDTDSLKYYKLNPSMTGITSNLCYNVERDFNTDITKMPEGILTWTKGNNLSIIGDDDEPEFTVKGGSSFGWSYVKLQINTPSGFTWESTKNFWTGLFNQTWVSGAVVVCPNITYTYTALVPGGHSPIYTYYWTYPSAWSKISQYQNNIQLRTTSTPIGGTVRVAINNECGTSAYSGITVYPGSCYYNYSLYPNPASNEVTITINEPVTIIAEDTDFSEEIVTNTIPTDQITYTIRIYNNLGTLVSTEIRTGTSFKIPLGNLRDGTYIVELNDGKNSYRELLIIKHE